MSEGPAEGEIRIGPSHQARLPDYKSDIDPIEMPEKCETLEELRWAPGVTDESVITKIQATNDPGKSGHFTAVTTCLTVSI